jgi:Dolichyl-phosphate-mannose-protein mannosyltransferase
MKNSAAKSRPGTIWSLNGLGNLAGLSIERHEGLFLLLAISVFSLSAIYRDIADPLWFDEFFTMFLSRLPTLSQLLQAIPCDGQPPLQYLLTRISLNLFGESELALRLPELLAYLAVGLLTYKIVRRHGTAIQALFAMAIVLGAPQFLTALDARPYALMLAFTAAAYFAWQTATLSGGRRVLPLFAVVLSIAGAVLSHHYGVIHVGLLLGAGETARLIQRRKLDGWMLASIVAGFSPLAITLTLAHQSSQLLGDPVRRSAVFWAKPTFSDLHLYLAMIPLWLLVLVAFWASLLLAERPCQRNAESAPKVPIHEWVAVGAMCLLLPAQILLAKVATGYFLGRYAVGTSFGMALLCAWGMPRLRPLRLVAEPALTLSLFVFLIATVWSPLINLGRQPGWQMSPGAVVLDEPLLSAPGELPIVVASAWNYPQVWWYSPPSIRQRLTYLSDVPYAVRQRQFLEELSLVFGQPYIPTRVSPYSEFLQAHKQFLLYCVGHATLEWVAPRLATEGLHLTLISVQGDHKLYLVAR